MGLRQSSHGHGGNIFPFWIEICMLENSADFETLYSSYSIDVSVSTRYVT